MKTKIFKNCGMFIGTILLGVLVCACSSSDPDPEPEPEKELSFSNQAVEFGSGQGEEMEVSIKSNTSWSIISFPSFVNVSPLNGKEGTTTIKIKTTAENPSTEQSREDVITVKYGEKQAKIIIKQEAKPKSKIYTNLTNILRMSSGLAFDYEMGSDVKYFYLGLFRDDVYKKLSKKEIEKQVVTGNINDRENDPENGTCYSNLYNDRLYYVVTVSFAEDDVQGETVITPLYTKPSDSQPEAKIENFRRAYDDVEQKVFYYWDVTRNNYCKSYYTYAAAYDKPFKTLSWVIPDNNDVVYSTLLAWAIKREIKRNKNSHSTSINTKNINYSLDGREEFFAEQVNDGTSKLKADIIFDYYAMVATWGTDASGELSGTLFWGYAQVQSSSSSMQYSVTTKSLGCDTPLRVDFNKNDIQVMRIK